MLAQHETERRRAVLGADEGEDVGNIRVPVWQKSHHEQQGFSLHSCLPVLRRAARRRTRCGGHGPKFRFTEYSYRW